MVAVRNDIPEPIRPTAPRHRLHERRRRRRRHVFKASKGVSRKTNGSIRGDPSALMSSGEGHTVRVLPKCSENSGGPGQKRGSNLLLLDSEHPERMASKSSDDPREGEAESGNSLRVIALTGTVRHKTRSVTSMIEEGSGN